MTKTHFVPGSYPESLLWGRPLTFSLIFKQQHLHKDQDLPKRATVNHVCAPETALVARATYHADGLFGRCCQFPLLLATPRLHAALFRSTSLLSVCAVANLTRWSAGNDDEVTAPLQIASYQGSYPYPEDFDGSTNIGEQVAYWQSHSGDIGGVDPV